MTDAPTELGAAATVLADVLERENRLLAALDLAGAAAMLADKQRAVAGFTAATERVRKAPPPAAQRAGLAAIGRRLARLAGDNRRLLERGMAAQSRLVAVFARAVRTAPTPAGRYGARGTLSVAARPLALSTRI
jgi:hypothetical protein